MTNSEAARQRANASFTRKELQVREGANAVADYQAAGRAVDAKTARLKALRLAREEQVRQAAAAKKSGPRH
jgi:division protein CdvB (Snf7/Vps24/ESCRT-III family)